MKKMEIKATIFGVLLFIVLYLLAVVLPYVRHKNVSDNFKTMTSSQEYYANDIGSERAAYLNDNTEAMIYRLKMIEEAEQEIIMSTFDFNADNAGKEMMSAMLHAAEKGVKVRILVDGISGLFDLKGNKWFQSFASNQNISIRIYNPINLLKPQKLQSRLHDKYLIIDNKMYLLGGRNVYDLFLGDYTSKKNIDRELFVYETKSDISNSLNDLKNYFEQVWELPDCMSYAFTANSEKIKQCCAELQKGYAKLSETYPQIMMKSSWVEETIETNKITLLSNPIEAENKEPWLWYSMNQLMRNGTDITIHTPYIICGKEMYADLSLLCESADSVNIIINDVASGGNPWGCTDYLNQKDKILQTGVRIYEYLNEYSSHSKTIRMDERISMIGSYNFDMRSTYLNTELMLVVDSADLNQLLKDEERQDMEYSRTITLDNQYIEGAKYHDKKISGGKKLMYGFLRILVRPIRRML